MVKNKKLAWRIIAGVCTILWTLVLFSYIAFPNVANVANFSLILNSVLYSFSICMSVALIFLPMKFYLYAILCWVWGLFNLVSGGSSNGLLMYALGCLFAYKQGLFVKRTPVTYLILLLPLIALAFQYRFGTTIMVASIMDFLFLLMFFLLVFILFGESFIKQKDEKLAEQADTIDSSGLTAEEILLVKEMVANKTFKSIEKDVEKQPEQVDEIDLSILTEEEKLITKDVLANKTFFTIGKERSKSESTIKQQMTGIYKKLNVTRKKHLLQLYENGKLNLP